MSYFKKGPPVNEKKIEPENELEHAIKALEHLSKSEEELQKDADTAVQKEQQEKLDILNYKSATEIFKEFTSFLSDHRLGYRILKLREGSVILGSVLINSNTGEPVIANNILTLTGPVELKKQSLPGYGSMQFMEDWITGAETNNPFPIQCDDILQVAMPTQSAITAYKVLQNKKAALAINPKLAGLLFSSPIMDKPENYDVPWEEPDFDQDNNEQQDPPW